MMKRKEQSLGEGERNSEKRKQQFKLKMMAIGWLKMNFGRRQSVQMGALAACLVLASVLLVGQLATAVQEEEAPASLLASARPVGTATKRFESIQRANKREFVYAPADGDGDDVDEAEAYTTPAISGRVQFESVSEPAPLEQTRQSVASLENDYPTASDNFFDNSPLAASPIRSSSGAGSSNETCYEYEVIVKGRPSPRASYAFMLTYGLIFLLGLSGNTLTLYVLFSKGSRCSAQDILLGNLAVSDVMLCVFAIPITPKYILWDHYWKMGQILCKLVSATQCISVYMSTYSLIVIGYIRYRLIVHPLGEAMSKQRSILYCLGTLIVACAFTYLYVRKVRVAPDYCEIKFCDEDWQGNERFYFSLFTCSCQLSIPLIAVIFFYLNIYRRLDHRITGGGGTRRATSGAGNHKPMAANDHTQDRVNHGNSLANYQNGRSVLEIRQSRQRERERRMRRMNKRLIWVVCIFAFSWFPLNLYNLLSDYYESLANWPYITYAFLVTHLIACSSVVWNPFLYAWMSDSFKDDLRRATPECLRTSKWLKTCLNEPSAASGLNVGGAVGGGGGALGAGKGGFGSPTSIVMVSTNGQHLHHAGLRAAGFGKDAVSKRGVVADFDTNIGLGTNPNGLTKMDGLTATPTDTSKELLQTKPVDQIASEIRLSEPVAETQLTNCCSDQADLEAVGELGRSNKSSDEVVSSQEELYDDDDDDEEPCRCLEEENETNGRQFDEYFIEICQERAGEQRHLSVSGSAGRNGGGDFPNEISTMSESIKLSAGGPNETTSANNGLRHWTRA